MKMRTATTIIYDSKCKFCTRFAKWINKKNSALAIVSVREVYAKSILKERGLKFIDLQTIYFIKEEKIFVRSKAVFEIFKFLRFPWKLLALFRYFPLSVTDFFYKLFAKYRYYF